MLTWGIKHASSTPQVIVFAFDFKQLVLPEADDIPLHHNFDCEPIFRKMLVVLVMMD